MKKVSSPWAEIETILKVENCSIIQKNLFFFTGGECEIYYRPFWARNEVWGCEGVRRKIFSNALSTWIIYELKLFFGKIFKVRCSSVNVLKIRFCMMNVLFCTMCHVSIPNRIGIIICQTIYLRKITLNFILRVI